MGRERLKPLTIRQAERRIRAKNPEAWDKATDEERAEALRLFNAEQDKARVQEEHFAFFRKQHRAPE